MHRALATILFVTLVAPATAFAGGTTVDRPFAIEASHFRSALGSRGYIVTDGAAISEHLKPAASLWLDYAHNILVTRDADGQILDDGRYVKGRLSANLQASLGLFDFMEIGIGLPLSLYQFGTRAGLGGSDDDLAAFAAGDLRIGAKFLVLDKKLGDVGLGLALHPIFTFPTGGRNHFHGDGSVTFRPTVAAELTSEHVSIALNAAYILRGKRDLLNVRHDDELHFGLGAAIPVEPDLVDIVLDLQAKIGVGAAAAGEFGTEEAPIEGHGGLRFWLREDLSLTVGGGTGLLAGYAAPEARVFAGIAYAPRPDEGDDEDGDGIADSEDACPEDPEDKDRFEDKDGCPDTDNDGDGIPDKEDACPDEAEDGDGFEDGDGCPDPDNDGDGIADGDDRCPLEPEDHDGDADEDGCPEEPGDRDGDRILDKDDSCPDEPEDIDSFEDADGCPDPDNDGDGIADGDDKCPLEAEVFNGVDDEDGCPDESLVEIKGEKIELKAKIFFSTGKATIKEKSFPVLDAAVKVMKAYPAITVRIEGHTDDRGAVAFNKKLSEARAKACLEYVAGKGVDASRMTAVGFGPEKPIADNTKKDGRAKNRRVEFVVTGGTPK